MFEHVLPSGGCYHYMLKMLTHMRITFDKSQQQKSRFADGLASIHYI